MPNVRLLPPGSGLRGSIYVNGRSYTCAQGSTIDVPQDDAAKMIANRWSACGGAVGPTSARPAKPNRGDTYLDTTLSLFIVWDDAAWRNPFTGGVV